MGIAAHRARHYAQAVPAAASERRAARMRARQPMNPPMRRFLAVAAVFVCLPDAALPQDKRMEAVCGDLFGARQTAIRLMQEGWPTQTIVQQTLDLPSGATPRCRPSRC